MRNPATFARFEPKLVVSERVIDALVAAARAACADGFPGGALKLGHDLWQHRDHARASYAMLGLAYEKLGRPILRDVLARAVAFRARCDREEAQKK